MVASPLCPLTTSWGYTGCRSVARSRIPAIWSPVSLGRVVERAAVGCAVRAVELGWLSKGPEPFFASASPVIFRSSALAGCSLSDS